MPKVSVIVPVYNNEKYLETCLNSIVRQKLKDIEIIIIDDGSTDKSAEICDKFALQDRRIKVIHNENKGLGYSYNLGIGTAEGEYIGFIESDDFTNERMYQDLYNLALEHNPDIVKSAWFDYQTDTNVREKNSQFTEYNSYEVIRTSNFPNLLFGQASVWSAIYKKEFLKNNPECRYLETPGASYQDVSFTFKVLTLAKSIVVTPNAYVCYRKDNPDSSINSKDKPYEIFVEYKEIDSFLEKFPNIKRYTNTIKLIGQQKNYLWSYDRIADHYKEEYLKRCTEDFQKYKDNGELSNRFLNSVNKDFWTKISQNLK